MARKPTCAFTGFGQLITSLTAFDGTETDLFFHSTLFGSEQDGQLIGSLTACDGEETDPFFHGARRRVISDVS